MSVNLFHMFYKIKSFLTVFERVKCAYLGEDGFVFHVLKKGWFTQLDGNDVQVNFVLTFCPHQPIGIDLSQLRIQLG